MQTLHHHTGVKPDHALANRLHALWLRRCARFREAHYAYCLADEHAERVGRDHPTYARARALAGHAARLMDILHKQTARLARAQIAAVGLIATVAPAHAGDDWTDDQQTKGVALATLAVADWAQTRNIARHPHVWHENNPLLGPHPSVAEVDRHFVASALIGAAILHALPTRYRDAALTAGIVIEAGCVANNLRIGVGLRF